VHRWRVHTGRICYSGSYGIVEGLWGERTMTISEARLPKKRKRINYERVRVVISEIKEMMKAENDRKVKMILAQAGLNLNKLLLK
jgi:hypothetical protein